MKQEVHGKRPRSCLGTLFLFIAVAVFVIFLTTNLYRPDAPIAAIVPGSSAEPSFFVQVIRPRAGLPFGGLIPPGLLGVDAELGFDSETADSKFTLENESLTLLGGKWELRLKFDAAGQIQPESEIAFDLIFEDQIRRVRCKPGNPPVGTFHKSEIAPNEFSGNFAIELPICDDAETGESLGWPPKPFILRGSFDRIPSVDHPE